MNTIKQEKTEMAHIMNIGRGRIFSWFQKGRLHFLFAVKWCVVRSVYIHVAAETAKIPAKARPVLAMAPDVPPPAPLASVGPLGVMAAGVTGAGVMGAGVTGAKVVGAGVTGAKVVGAGVTGAKVVGAGVTGAKVVGAKVGAGVTGDKVVGTGVTGAKVVGTGVTGTSVPTRGSTQFTQVAINQPLS